MSFQNGDNFREGFCGDVAILLELEDRTGGHARRLAQLRVAQAGIGSRRAGYSGAKNDHLAAAAMIWGVGQARAMERLFPPSYAHSEELAGGDVSPTRKLDTSLLVPSA